MRSGEHLQTPSGSTEIVVADTSPLNYLVQISCDFLLPSLFHRIVVPPSVVAELSHSGAPRSVAMWAATPPRWIEILPPKAMPDTKLSLLDPGERDAIQLALELQVPTLLIDERRGRREAQSRGLTTLGTIGVIIAGATAGIINAEEAYDRLIRETTFRATDSLRQSFIAALSGLKNMGT